jgi:hypothetical protein
VINRLPAEELLRAVRISQAEWRSQLRRGTEQGPVEPADHWWTRRPELPARRRPAREPGGSSLAAPGF